MASPKGFSQIPIRPLARTRGQTKRVLACITLIVKEQVLPVRQEEQQTIANSTPTIGNVKQPSKENLKKISRLRAVQFRARRADSDAPAAENSALWPDKILQQLV